MLGRILSREKHWVNEKNKLLLKYLLDYIGGEKIELLGQPVRVDFVPLDFRWN